MARREISWFNPQRTEVHFGNKLGRIDTFQGIEKKMKKKDFFSKFNPTNFY